MRAPMLSRLINRKDNQNMNALNQLKIITQTMSKAEAAERIGISLNSLNDYLSEAREPRNEIKNAIYELYKATRPTLKERRESLGLSQTQLAYFATVDVKTVKAWETNGISNIKAKNLAILASILGITTDELLMR